MDDSRISIQLEPVHLIGTGRIASRQLDCLAVSVDCKAIVPISGLYLAAPVVGSGLVRVKGNCQCQS